MNELLMLLGSVCLIGFILLILKYDNYLKDQIEKNDNKQEERDYVRKNRQK